MDGFSECLTPLAFLLVYSSVYSRVYTFFLATENKLQTLQTVHADRTIALILDDHVKYVINYPRPFLPRWQTNVNVNKVKMAINTSTHARGVAVASTIA